MHLQHYDVYLLKCFSFHLFKFYDGYRKTKNYALFNGRCVVLLDPLKESSRAQDSWNSMLLKLRTLLLMSFTKNLGRFEDDMRTLREKRTQPGWSFCEYFMVQVWRQTGVGLHYFTGSFVRAWYIEQRHRSCKINDFVLLLLTNHDSVCMCACLGGWLLYPGGACLCFWDVAAVWRCLGPIRRTRCSLYTICS